MTKKGKSSIPPAITTAAERAGKKEHPVQLEAIKALEQLKLPGSDCNILGPDYNSNTDRGKLVKAIINALGVEKARQLTGEEAEGFASKIARAFADMHVRGHEGEEQKKSDVRRFFGSDAVLQAWREKRWEGAGSVFDFIKELERAGFNETTNKVMSVDQMDAVATRVKARNAVITEREAEGPDVDDNNRPISLPCESLLHEGTNPPIQPTAKFVVNRETLEVVLYIEGKKEGQPRKTGNFTVLPFPLNPGDPTSAKELRTVHHCSRCKAHMNALAREEGTVQPWLSYGGAEARLYFELHKEEFEERKNRRVREEAVTSQIRGGIGFRRTDKVRGTPYPGAKYRP